MVATGLDFPNVTFKPDLLQRNLAREFTTLNQMLGYQNSPVGNGITYIDFLQGYGIIVSAVLFMLPTN